jgi:hypothetical protein
MQWTGDTLDMGMGVGVDEQLGPMNGIPWTGGMDEFLGPMNGVEEEFKLLGWSMMYIDVLDCSLEPLPF